MFILSKGKPKTFNPIKVNTVRNGMELLPRNKPSDGANRKNQKRVKKRKK